MVESPSVVLSHDLHMLAWIAEVVEDTHNVQWSPACKGYYENLDHKVPSDVTRIKVTSQKADTCKVHEESKDRTDDHLVVDFVNFAEDIQDLTDDQSTKSNRDDICKRLMEPVDRSKHDYRALEQRLPHPDKESLRVQNSTFLQG